MVSAYRGYLPSRLAQADLEDIHVYTLQNWSPRQAEIYHANLIAAFRGLVSGERMGRTTDVAPGYLKLRSARTSYISGRTAM
jgi:toxin ParE1/3/4